MYDIRLVTDDVKLYKGYISPDIYAGFSNMSNRFLLAGFDEGKAVGICVFDAAPVTGIVDVGITADCKNRNKLRRGFIRTMLGICENLHAKVLTLSLYDDDDFSEWEKVLEEYRFEMDEETKFYRFKIDSIYENPRFMKLKKNRNAVLLEKAGADQIREIDSFLKESGMFAGLTDERIRKDLSSVYIEKDKIEGVLLISDIPDGICVEYVYVSDRDSQMLAAMVGKTVNAIANDRNLTETAVGELACVNKSSVKLFLKLFPEYEKLGEQRTYFTAIEM